MEIKKMTKQYLGAYGSYNRSNMYQLEDLYNNASIYKHRAYNYCVNLMQKLNGHDLKIIGGNCMTFSVGFLFEQDGKECFAYITKSYDRFFEI
jgi:hypothetical protein